MKHPFSILLLKIYLAQASLFRPYMDEIGLSPGQPKILNFLSKHGDSMQKEVAKGCDIEPATVSRLLNNMEKHGLIERIQVENNKRAFHIILTEKGNKVQKKVERHRKKIENQELAGFSEEEKEKFREYMCRLYYNMTGTKLH